MAKKKISDNLRLYYRGTKYQPPKVASDQEQDIIHAVLEDVMPKKNGVFQFGSSDPVRLSIGLSSGLRNLKNNKTKAIIYDEIASKHLVAYLNHCAERRKIPIIQAKNLGELARKFAIHSMLMISFIEVGACDKSMIEVQSSEALDKLSAVLTQNQNCIRLLKPPLLEKVPSTGKSKAKKMSRKSMATTCPQQNT